MKIRFPVLLLAMSLLTGCGEIVVFGHTVREAPTPTAETSARPTTQPPEQNEAAAAAAPTSGTQTEPEKSSIPVARKVHSVTVTVAPSLTTKMAKESNFNATALEAAIKREMQSRKLLIETDGQNSARADIVVEKFALRPKSNVILFGYSINSGTLSGELRVHDGGEDLVTSVAAEARVSIPEGEDADRSEDPLIPLYRRFSVLVANRLAGTPDKPETTEDQPPR